MENKTNVMRILDKNKIDYIVYDYVKNGSTNGVEIAGILNKNPNMVFKTLVTIGKSKNNYVFVIPVNHELDLKKAANCVQEKSIEMIKSKELLPLTGYIHGGCSPIGMRKVFRTVFDKSMENNEKILFSAGKIGLQVELNISDLIKVIDYSKENIIKD